MRARRFTEQAPVTVGCHKTFDTRWGLHAIAIGLIAIASYAAITNTIMPRSGVASFKLAAAASLAPSSNGSTIGQQPGGRGNVSVSSGAQSSGFRSAQANICPGLRLIERRDWGAKESRTTLQPFSRPPNRIIIHQAWDGRTCADLDSCIVRLQAIQAYHQHTKHWPDISYNFLISGDGTIYEGVGLHKMGFHTLNYNQESLGVALIGTFHDVYPTAKMEESLGNLIGCAVRSGNLAPDYQLHGHRDARCTICPGDAAYRRISTMQRFRPGPLPLYSCPSFGLRAAALLAQKNGSFVGGGGDDDDHDGRMLNNEEPALVKGRQMININSYNQLVAISAATKAPPAQSKQDNKTQARKQQQRRPTVAEVFKPTELIEEAFVGLLRRRHTSGGQFSGEPPAGGPQPVSAAAERDERVAAQIRLQTSAGETNSEPLNGRNNILLVNLEPASQSSGGGGARVGQMGPFQQSTSVATNARPIFYVLAPQRPTPFGGAGVSQIIYPIANFGFGLGGAQGGMSSGFGRPGPAGSGLGGGGGGGGGSGSRAPAGGALSGLGSTSSRGPPSPSGSSGGGGGSSGSGSGGSRGGGSSGGSSGSGGLGGLSSGFGSRPGSTGGTGGGGGGGGMRSPPGTLGLSSSGGSSTNFLGPRNPSPGFMLAPEIESGSYTADGDDAEEPHSAEGDEEPGETNAKIVKSAPVIVRRPTKVTTTSTTERTSFMQQVAPTPTTTPTPATTTSGQHSRVMSLLERLLEMTIFNNITLF